MLIEETAGDTWRHHPPSESEVLTGQVGPKSVEFDAILDRVLARVSR